MDHKAVVLGSRPAFRGALVFVALLLVLVATAAAPADDAAALVGSWKLVTYEDREAEGTPVYAYGRAPEGLLVYDASGHMAVQIMKTPPPDVSSDDWSLFTTQEKIRCSTGTSRTSADSTSMRPAK